MNLSQMNRVRILVVLAALLAGALAAYLANGIISKKAAPQLVEQPPKPVTVEVLVAARDVALGEKMANGALEWRPWPRDNAANLITRDAKPDAAEAMSSARARQQIYAGEPVIERKVVATGDGGFMSAVLPRGMRAISVAISEQSAAGGFILPDDRVDVIVTRKYNSSGGGNTAAQSLALTETVLSNVRVLAINQTFRKEGDDNVTVPEVKTAVLELDPYQTEIITKAEALGELSLSLRSLAEGGDVGVRDAKPELADSYKQKKGNPGGGSLVIRYGVESTVANP